MVAASSWFGAISACAVRRTTHCDIVAVPNLVPHRLPQVAQDQGLVRRQLPWHAGEARQWNRRGACCLQNTREVQGQKLLQPSLALGFERGKTWRQALRDGDRREIQMRRERDERVCVFGRLATLSQELRRSRRVRPTSRGRRKTWRRRVTYCVHFLTRSASHV